MPQGCPGRGGGLTFFSSELMKHAPQSQKLARGVESQYCLRRAFTPSIPGVHLQIHPEVLPESADNAPIQVQKPAERHACQNLDNMTGLD